MSFQAALKLSEQEDEEQTCSGPSAPRPPPRVALFVKAGSDKECIGCCPFSQRLFMILWLKGVVFNVTTVNKATMPKKLSDLASGNGPPFLLFNEEVLTDTAKSEEFIEAELYPPNYPKLACKYHESQTAGNDIFHKFSAVVKYREDKRSDKYKGMEMRLVEVLRKFDNYLRKPLDHEIDADSEDKEEESKRKFIDGNFLTLADCNILPKLNIIRATAKYTGFDIPAEFIGIHRYLQAADETEEFKQTCPSDCEINWTYKFSGLPKH